LGLKIKDEGATGEVAISNHLAVGPEVALSGEVDDGREGLGLGLGLGVRLACVERWTMADCGSLTLPLSLPLSLSPPLPLPLTCVERWTMAE